MSLVAGLVRAGELRYDLLQLRQARERLRRVERARPLAVLEGRDTSAVVVDEGHARVPVAAGEVERREALVLAELRHQLLAAGHELVERRRCAGRNPSLAIEVDVVDEGAHAGVVRHAVELAVVRGRVRQPAEPRLRVREAPLRRREIGERAGRHVLRHLAVAELDHVGSVPARERGVELRQVLAPRLVLDVDVHAWMLGLERRVRGRDGLGPVALRVDHQPDGDAVRGRTRGGRRLRATRRRRRECQQGHTSSRCDKS